MSPERWRQVETIVSQALDCDTATRPAFVRQACGDDESLRTEVESLLSYEGRGGRALAAIVGGAAAMIQSRDLGLHEGDRIGVYRVIREIGRGGMGTVYLAERDDEIRKRVAIKVVTRGMDTAELLRRFRYERQILARLDHPNIARLLDGGTTADGRPYFVMDYVEGKPITEYCTEHGLSARERIELFRRVCAAVQSAHQSLVVHRDLKPGNILVDAHGFPKLLDFGVAKLLGPEEGPGITILAGGMQMLTPDYASPEQVRGDPITTAADVYALGATLYELLTGLRPHRLRNYTATEIERAICQQDPERPSTASRRAIEQGSANALPLKSGDLDNIILMAMQKEPARRYASVADFSEDLRRSLANLPVLAREDTIHYRARKFLRRHGAAVAAGGLLMATLAGGVTVSTIQGHRAQRRFNEVRRIAHAVLYDIHDAIRDLPGSTKAREVVVNTALQYLDGLAREAAGDPEIQLELAEAYKRIGDVQGDAVERSLGRSEDALKSYRKSESIADELARKRPDLVQADIIRMDVRHQIGNLTATRGGNALAQKVFQETMQIGEGSAARHADSSDVLRSLSRVYLTSARQDSDSARSLANARKGLAILERVAARQSGDEALLTELSDGYSMVGTTLLRGNDLEGALAELIKAVQIREQLVAANPLNARNRRQLMIGYSKVGDVLGPVTPSLQQPARALEYYRKTLAIAEALAAADPADQRGAVDHAMALLKVGIAAPQIDEKTAQQTLQQALTIFEGLAAADPKDSRLQRYIMTARNYTATRLAAAGDAVGAVRTQREVIRLGEQLLGISSGTPDLGVLRALSHSYEAVAESLAAASQRMQAIETSEKAITTAVSARAVDGSNPVTQALLPEAYAAAASVRTRMAASAKETDQQRRQDWAHARDFYEQAAAAWEQIHPKGGWPKDRDGQIARARSEAARSAAELAALH